MQVLGSCHCGNVSFALSWDPEPQQIPARACDCSFCVKHGGVWTSNPAGALQVRVRRRADVAPYAFGTGTARFHVCKVCGVVPFVTSEIDGRSYAVVNVNAFTNVPATQLARVPASFEGEDVAARLRRRQRGWIAQVQVAYDD